MAQPLTFPFRQVDVFADAGFAGNPLAVVHDADALSTEQMARVANWTNLSETAFLLAPTEPGADYRVRIFTPYQELPFAGHPTLGSCAAWLDAGGTPTDPTRIVQQCEAGLVPIRPLDSGALAFAAPPLMRGGEPTAAERTRAINILGADEADVLAMEWIDNGPGWIGVLLADAATVLALEPAAVDDRPADVVAVGRHDDTAETDLELRAVFGNGGAALIEDPVTGSANASVAQWLTRIGHIAAPYTAAQGTRLGRRGRIEVSEHDGEIWVGGHSTIHITGTIAV